MIEKFYLSTLNCGLPEAETRQAALAEYLRHPDISTTQRYEHSDTQTVGAFLHSAVKIDIPADSSEGLSENIPLKLEQNLNNKVPQRCPKTEDSPSVLSPRSIKP